MSELEKNLFEIHKYILTGDKSAIQKKIDNYEKTKDKLEVNDQLILDYIKILYDIQENYDPDLISELIRIRNEVKKLDIRKILYDVRLTISFLLVNIKRQGNLQKALNVLRHLQVNLQRLQEPEDENVKLLQERFAYINGIYFYKSRKLDDAILEFQRAKSLASELNLDLALARIEFYLGLIEYRKRKPNISIKILEDNLEIFKQKEDKIYLKECLEFIIEISLRLNFNDKANSYNEQYKEFEKMDYIEQLNSKSNREENKTDVEDKKEQQKKKKKDIDKSSTKEKDNSDKDEIENPTTEKKSKSEKTKNKVESKSILKSMKTSTNDDKNLEKEDETEAIKQTKKEIEDLKKNIVEKDDIIKELEMENSNLYDKLNENELNQVEDNQENSVDISNFEEQLELKENTINQLNDTISGLKNANKDLKKQVKEYESEIKDLYSKLKNYQETTKKNLFEDIGISKSAESLDELLAVDKLSEKIYKVLLREKSIKLRILSSVVGVSPYRCLQNLSQFEKLGIVNINGRDNNQMIKIIEYGLPQK